jgi:hypothetical protein
MSRAAIRTRYMIVIAHLRESASRVSVLVWKAFTTYICSKRQRGRNRTGPLRSLPVGVHQTDIRAPSSDKQLVGLGTTPQHRHQDVICMVSNLRYSAYQLQTDTYWYVLLVDVCRFRIGVRSRTRYC